MVTKCEPKSLTFVAELYRDGKLGAPIFNQMCHDVAANQPGCSVSLGPNKRHLIKTEASLRRKIDTIRLRQLGMQPPYCKTLVQEPTYLKTTVLFSLLVCAVGAWAIVDGY